MLNNHLSEQAIYRKKKKAAEMQEQIGKENISWYNWILSQ